MKYQVDLEKKEIVYDKDVPAGHIIALKKIFEQKKYKFKEVESLQSVDELIGSIDLKGSQMTMGRTFTGPGSLGGYTTMQLDPEDYTMQKLQMEQRRMEHEDHMKRKMKHAEHISQMGGLRTGGDYYSPDGKAHGSEQEMYNWMHIKKLQRSPFYFENEMDHPADKSNYELKSEASKIKEEVNDIKEASGLINKLNQLKGQLGFNKKRE